MGTRHDASSPVRTRPFGFRRVRCVYVRSVPTSPFTPDPADPRYLYEQLADYIAEQIANGELRPGDRLPAEREFGEVYGVSLGTARRAVAILRERGLVITKPITGTFVAKR